MLIAAIIALYSLFGGSSGIDSLLGNITNGELKGIVEDESLRNQIVEISKKLTTVQATRDEEATELLDQFFDMQLEYDASPEDFKAHAEKMETLLTGKLNTALAAREEIRELLNEEQWTELFSDR